MKPRVSCTFVCVILRLAALIQYRSVTDTHTHRLTDRHDDGIFLARIASRGKNQQDRQMGIDKVQSVSATSLW